MSSILGTEVYYNTQMDVALHKISKNLLARTKQVFQRRKTKYIYLCCTCISGDYTFRAIIHIIYHSIISLWTPLELVCLCIIL